MQFVLSFGMELLPCDEGRGRVVWLLNDWVPIGLHLAVVEADCIQAFVQLGALHASHEV